MREAIVAAIGAERADLLARLKDVQGDAWGLPTVCAPWTVKDVLAHVVEGEIQCGLVYRGETTDLGRVDPEEVIARWRALPGEAVRAALWQHGIAAQRVLDAMKDETWGADIRAFGCHRMGQLVRLHLFDLGVHGRDLTDALGMDPTWEPRLPWLTEFVVRALPQTLRRHGAQPEGRLTVLVPALGRSWTVDGSGGDWALADGVANVDATATFDPEGLVLLTTGRAPFEQVHPTLEGDTGLARRILDAWRVV